MSALAWTASILVALGVILAASHTVWKLLRRVGHALDDLNGEPERPGVPARPGVMERLASIDKTLSATDRRVAAIEHELRPNSGLSLRDAVDRVEQAVTDDPETR